ncbi:MAG: ThiF family adenylyltransferase [Egibacteraceae bacterium]
MDELYRERFARTFGILDESQMRRISATTVAVAGLGMGGSTFIDLVRLGFERFHVADPDVYERTNINRQRVATEATIGKRKDDTLIAEARAVNPAIAVEAFADGVQADNVERFLDGVDWVVDTVDVYAMDCKLLLAERAHQRGIPLVSCATLGHGAVVMVFDPADPAAPSFAQLSGITAEGGRQENLDRFVTMMMPEVPDYMLEQAQRAMEGKGHIPFVVTGVEVAAVLAGVQILNHMFATGARPPARPTAPRGVFCEPVALRLEEFVSPATGGR